MRKIFTLLALLLVNLYSYSQDFSNKGKDFWVGYGLHCRMFGTGGNTQEMVLYFATESATNVKVEMPSLGYVQNYSIPANTIFTTSALPKSGAQDARITTEGISGKGIHITSDKPIVAYAHIYNGNVSGATLLFPTNTLGREYYSMNYTQNSNEANSNAFFYAVAADTGTTVIEVIPSANTQGMTAGQTYTYTLKQGEIFNALGIESFAGGGVYSGSDLTGSIIRSKSVNGVCKKIAVFSGAGKLFIRCAANQGNSADNYMVQAFPKNAWGKYFLTVPTKTMDNNFFRIGVQDPTTVVKVNGAVLSGLINNFYYQLGPTNNPSLIESDKPIMVAQYITTQGTCGNGTPGDPEVIYLSPVEQNINKVILNSTPNSAITGHYINVVIPNGGTGVSSFRIDGVPPAGGFVMHPGNNAYSYLQLPTVAGQHTIQSDSGFNAIAYGYGNAESYGYNAGTNVIDLYQYVSTTNQYATVNSPTACKGSPFLFSITLPYVPISMKWTIPNYPDYVNNLPTADSSFIKNGKQVYVFKLPASYVYSAIGSYPVVVTVNNPTVDGCSGEQIISFDLEVYNPPVADFSWPAALCTDSIIPLTTNNITGGRPITKHFWDFGDGTYAYTNNPGKVYTKPGTYKIRYAVLTDVGCLSDTLEKTISVSNTPVAKFGFSAPQCKDKVITFSDASSLSGGVGSITNWNWNPGVGSPVNNISNANVTASYPNIATYNPTLQVKTNTGCLSPVYTMPVVIHPNPVPDFSMSIACLPDGVVNFSSTTTITDGTQGSFLYNWNFGDAGTGVLNSAIIQNPSHQYATTGPYSIKLKVTSVNGCIDSITKNATTIYPQPKAGFTAPAEVCDRATVTMTDASDGITHPLTKWEWRFINSGGTIVGSSSVKDASFVFPAAGTYKIRHWTYSNQGCVSDTAEKTIIINLLPSAINNFNTPLCEKNQIIINDLSTANSGSLVRWYWNLGDGTIVNATNNNPLTHTYASYGTKVTSLLVENSKGCLSDTLTKSVQIHPLPQIGYVLPEVCLSDAKAIFSDTSTIADNSEAQLTYLWNFNTAVPPINPGPVPVTSTGKNPQIQFNKADNYFLSLVVTSKDGCKDSVTKIQFTVNGSFPKADFLILPTNGLCSNRDIQIKENSSVDFGDLTKVEIYWDNANSPAVFETDENPSKNKIYSHRYPDFQSPITKTYQVRYRAYTGIICVDDVIKTITVNASPLTQFLPMVGICVNDVSKQISEASELGGLSGTGVFSGAGVSASGLFTPSMAGEGIHSIRYTFTASNGCVHYTDQTIEVWPKPFVDAGPDLAVLEDGMKKITDVKASGTGLQFLWTPATYLDSVNIQFPTITRPKDDITYTITVTNTQGCSSKDDLFVRILKMPKPPNTFTPNGDGINDTWEIKYLNDYPGTVIEVYNTAGTLVYRSIGYSTPWDGKWKGQPLPAGTYYYIMDPKNGRARQAGYVTILR